MIHRLTIVFKAEKEEYLEFANMSQFADELYKEFNSNLQIEKLIYSENMKFYILILAHSDNSTKQAEQKLIVYLNKFQQVKSFYEFDDYSEEYKDFQCFMMSILE